MTKQNKPPSRANRIPVDSVECRDCGEEFGRTEAERKRNSKQCPGCRRVTRALRPGRVNVKPNKLSLMHNLFEVVLPRSQRSYYDKKKDEWYMLIRTRKKRTDEPLVRDRVYLEIKGADADPVKVKHAFDTAYVRLQLQGASRYPREVNIKKLSRKHSRLKHKKSLPKGSDRDLGITRVIVKSARFRATLADPMEDKKRHYLGSRFMTRNDAREARDKLYHEIKLNVVPCAVCGVLPVYRQGFLTHMSSQCPNRVQLPSGVRTLYQSKLWNLIFSKGDHAPGRMTQYDLARMGFMYHTRTGYRLYFRADVGFDFSLAENYAKTVKIDEARLKEIEARYCRKEKIKQVTPLPEEDEDDEPMFD